MARPATARRAGIGLLVAAVAATAGCGVGPNRAPVKVGDGLVAGADVGGDAEITPRGPRVEDRPTEVVALFLQAAAGGGDSATGTVRRFLTEDAVRKWSPGQEKQPTVVRLLAAPIAGAGSVDTATVTISYQTVGTMTSVGTLDPLPPTKAQRVFHLVKQGTPEWRIKDPPDGMVLSVDGLKAYYRARPIYFWDSTDVELVPDLRYLPLTTKVGLRPNAVVDWLVAGPSRWLGPAVRTLPEGTVKKESVVKSNNRWVVNLSAQAGGDLDSLARLYYQLRWSMQVVTTDPIELEVEGQRKDVTGSKIDLNTANPAERGPLGQRFTIVKHRVVPPSGVDSAVMTDATNVVYAAVDLLLTRAAYVRVDQFARRYLTILRSRNDTVTPVRVDLAHTSRMGRPAWIPGTDRLLIPINGELYAVSANGAVNRITPAGHRSVVSVSVPRDGRRVGLVMDGGRAYVGALVVDGPIPSVAGSLREIAPGQLTAAGIAWLDGSHVVVAGAAGPDTPALVEATCDGAYATDRQLSLSGFVLTDVVALPNGTPSDVIVETSRGEASNVYTGSVQSLRPAVDSVFYSG
jgi:sporulation and spore germination protein